MTHCNGGLPIGDDITVELSDLLDWFLLDEGSVNCRPGSAEYEATEEGVFLLEMDVTFSDFSTCHAEATVTVEDPMP